MCLCDCTVYVRYQVNVCLLYNIKSWCIKVHTDLVLKKVRSMVKALCEKTFGCVFMILHSKWGTQIYLTQFLCLLRHLSHCLMRLSIWQQSQVLSQTAGNTLHVEYLHLCLCTFQKGTVLKTQTNGSWREPYCREDAAPPPIFHLIADNSSTILFGCSLYI